MSLTLLNILLLSSSLSHSLTHYEPNLLPSNSDGYCNVTDTVVDYRQNKCLNTMGCGWCYNNATGTKSCKFVGICFYKDSSVLNECEVIDHSVSCNLIRLLGFLVIIGVICSTMSCSLTILRHCMMATSCETLVYFVGMITVLFYSLLPVFLMYYTTFSTFCIATITQLALSTTFWLCGSTEKVRKVYLNKNHSEYQRIPDGETGRLLN